MYLSGQGKVGRGRGGGKKLAGRKDKRKLAGTLEARHRGLPPLGKRQVQVRKRVEEHALSKVANCRFEKCVTQHA